MNPTSLQTGKLVDVQALRAIAALIVVLGHSVSIHGGMGLDLWACVAVWFGTCGVDLFFVISGFIVVSVALREASERAAPPPGARCRWRPAVRFALRRASRVYPVYWLVLGFSALVNRGLPLAPAWLPHAGIVPLVLLTTRYNFLVPPAWTLASEVYFYAVLSLILLIAPSHVFRALSLWLAVESVLIGYVWLAQRDDLRDHRWIGILTNPQTLEFGFGCAVAALIRSGARAQRALSLTFGLVGLIFGGLLIRALGEQGVSPLSRTFTFGLGGAFLLYALVSSELTDGPRSPSVLRRIGDASYSLYLWHLVLLACLSAFTFETSLPHLLPGWSIWSTWLAVVVGWSFASYRFFEQPVLRWATRAIERWLGGAARDLSVVTGRAEN